MVFHYSSPNKDIYATAGLTKDPEEGKAQQPPNSASERPLLRSAEGRAGRAGARTSAEV